MRFRVCYFELRTTSRAFGIMSSEAYIALLYNKAQFRHAASAARV
jgi:hypothetical protein